MAAPNIVQLLQQHGDRDHWCKVRAENQTRLDSMPQPNDGRSHKQSKEKNGVIRFLSLP